MSSLDSGSGVGVGGRFRLFLAAGVGFLAAFVPFFDFTGDSGSGSGSGESGIRASGIGPLFVSSLILAFFSLRSRLN